MCSALKTLLVSGPLEQLSLLYQGAAMRLYFFSSRASCMEFYIIVFLTVFPIAFRTVFFLISGATLAAKIDLGTYVTWFQNR